jgi:hypothetical protein
MAGQVFETPDITCSKEFTYDILRVQSYFQNNYVDTNQSSITNEKNISKNV